MAERSGGFKAVSVKRATGVENSTHRLHDSGWSGGNKASASLSEKLRIALFLARDDFGNDHWRVRRKSLLDRGSTGFADEQMAAPNEVRHFRNPTQNLDRPPHFGSEVLDSAGEVFVASAGDGKRDVFESEESPCCFHGLIALGIDHVEDIPDSVGGRDLARFRGWSRKLQRNRKTGNSDFGARDSFALEHLGSGIVRDEIGIGSWLEPN